MIPPDVCNHACIAAACPIMWPDLGKCRQGSCIISSIFTHRERTMDLLTRHLLMHLNTQLTQMVHRCEMPRTHCCGHGQDGGKSQTDLNVSQQDKIKTCCISPSSKYLDFSTIVQCFP